MLTVSLSMTWNSYLNFFFHYKEIQLTTEPFSPSYRGFAISGSVNIWKVFFYGFFFIRFVWVCFFIILSFTLSRVVIIMCSRLITKNVSVGFIKPGMACDSKLGTHDVGGAGRTCKVTRTRIRKLQQYGVFHQKRKVRSNKTHLTAVHNFTTTGMIIII